MEKAAAAAALCLYSYLWERHIPAIDTKFEDIVARLPAQDQRTEILQNAAAGDKLLAQSKLGGSYYTDTGTQAFFFTDPLGAVTLVFRGTGRGEWTDNGMGLSGRKMESTYKCFGVRSATLYATGQQLEAMELTCRWAWRYGWKNITVTGHSKGGNKAQFIALNADIAQRCYSFDGQGFSPEALSSFADFEERRKCIFSISAENDYVNVLGQRAALPHRILFLESRCNGFSAHRMEAILQQDGSLTPIAEQGEFSRKLERASQRVMALPPALRQYATTGLMDLVQDGMGISAVGGEVELTLRDLFE